MKTKTVNKNKQFMTGIAVMVFAVFCVIAIFLMMCYDRMDAPKQMNAYQIELAAGFSGDSARIYLNDSIVYNGLVSGDTTRIKITPFAEEHVLMVEDPQTGRSSNFGITEKSGRIIVRKVDGGMVMVTEQEWENK